MLITATIATGCSTTQEPTTSAATATPPTSAWNYPPVEYHMEIAVPLDDATADAARFAMQVVVDGIPALDDPDLAAELLARVTSEYALPAWYKTTDMYRPLTGGEVHKTVNATVIDDHGTIEFTVCRYYTPGLYSRNGLIGALTRGYGPNDPPYNIRSPRVRFTTEPRWLVVGRGKELHTESQLDEVREACEPFKPEPFVQVTPTATAPG